MPSKATCKKCHAINLLGQGVTFDVRLGLYRGRDGQLLQCGVDACDGVLRKFEASDRSATIAHARGAGDHTREVIRIPPVKPPASAQAQERRALVTPGVDDAAGQMMLFKKSGGARVS